MKNIFKEYDVLTECVKQIDLQLSLILLLLFNVLLWFKKKKKLCV